MQLRTYPGLWARRTTTLAMGTTATNAGLDIAIPAGVFQLRAVLPTVNVGSPTNVNAELSFTGTIDWVIGSFTRWAGITATAVYDNAFPLVTTGAAASVATMTVLSADFRATAAGTLSMAMLRTGGTSSTIQIGASMTLLRIA